ncbi:Protein kinase domain-containing protein [Mycena venus]|uniref:Protein kinase domain-containing protein n=1 Tax=Mycena venus TaxID=2733690 RepID=A0A8H7CDL9_9AGAR|nr:Protein kinase domain-containing protein [Mycena venus]
MSGTDDGWLFVGPESDDYEPSQSYAPGGLCPVKLGDLIGSGTPPRYRIIFKLGFGSFSTVWLAHDSVESRNVALKIVQARSTARSQEPDVLERLRALNSTAGQEPYVIQLLDSFEHTSANGIHQVLVTELVVPLLAPYSRYSKFKPQVTRDVLRQTIEGLAYIHSHGVAHGDLYPANFGITVPEIHRFEELAFWHQATYPPLRPIIPFSPHCDPHSYPPYLCGNLDLCEFLGFRAPEIIGRPLSVRIFDFGSAYVVDGSAPPQPVTPPFYAAPEIVFPQVALKKEDPPWDQRSDVWSLGVAFHDLVGAGGLFPELLFDDTELPHYMVCICGEVPDAWRDHIDSQPWPLAFSPRHDRGVLEWKERALRPTWRGGPPGLVRLMRRMLVLDPAKRPSAQDLLDDPYFSCSNGARNVVGSVHPLMQLPAGIPHGEEADLQTNRPNLLTLD